MQSLTTIAIAVLLCMGGSVRADEFTEQDIKEWQAAYESVVQEGRKVFADPELGSNGVVCAQCHPNGANTHPETYPKVQKQLGRVVAVWEMVNWCISNSLEGENLAADDPRMIGLQAYMAHERRRVELTPGKYYGGAAASQGAAIPTGIGAFICQHSGSIPYYTVLADRRYRPVWGMPVREGG